MREPRLSDQVERVNEGKRLRLSSKKLNGTWGESEFEKRKVSSEMGRSRYRLGSKLLHIPATRLRDYHQYWSILIDVPCVNIDSLHTASLSST